MLITVIVQGLESCFVMPIFDNIGLVYLIYSWRDQFPSWNFLSQLLKYIL
jgi:hypothetical protein